MSKIVLILYYSRHGATKAMANSIALGVEKSGLEARLRCVPEVSNNFSNIQNSVPSSGDPYVVKQDLDDCCGFDVSGLLYSTSGPSGPAGVA